MQKAEENPEPISLLPQTPAGHLGEGPGANFQVFSKLWACWLEAE